MTFTARGDAAGLRDEAIDVSPLPVVSRSGSVSHEVDEDDHDPRSDVCVLPSDVTQPISDKLHV